MDIPKSAYGHPLYRSTSVEWCGMDSKENFDENIKDANKSKIIRDMGFDKPGCITYTYNSRGFRDREFDHTPSGIALGCSFTQGIGIPAKHTWPSQLSNMLKTNIWNLGVGGGSSDTAYNLLEHYLDELNVQFVVLCAPFMARFEFFRGEEPVRIIGNNLVDQRWYDSFLKDCFATEKNSLTNLKKKVLEIQPDQQLYDSFTKEWFATEKNSLINQKKNKLAMQQMCYQRNIPFYHLHVATDFRFDKAARDCTHSGIDSNLEFAVKMHNKITGNNI